jgi:hypothetical protein
MAEGRGFFNRNILWHSCVLRLGQPRSELFAEAARTFIIVLRIGKFIRVHPC